MRGGARTRIESCAASALAALAIEARWMQPHDSLGTVGAPLASSTARCVRRDGLYTRAYASRNGVRMCVVSLSRFGTAARARAYSALGRRKSHVRTRRP
eukprot:6897803-Prymnesium_polylepis.1